MKILRNLIILIGLLVVNEQMVSQIAQNVANQSYNSNDNIPINFSTGSPSVNIPIWNASSNSISFPINISYSANGVGLQEIPSFVGMSWQLNAFGTISQVIRDKNDWNGFIKTGNKVIDTAYQNNIDYLKKDDDKEADLFKINLPGLSYNFMYDNTGTSDNDASFFTLTKSNIKIKMNLIGNNNNDGFENGGVFIITDANGIEYMFELVKNLYIYYSECDGYKDGYNNYNWYLTKITNTNTNDFIKFEYQFEENKYYYTGKHYSYNSKNNIWGSGFNNLTFPYISEQLNKCIRLKSIETNTEKIIFTINNFEDFNNEVVAYNTCFESDNGLNTVPILEKIEVKNKINNEIIFTYDFSYSLINNRIFLDKIQQIGSNGTKLNPYHFTYSKPNKLHYIKNNEKIIKKKIDFWGFINSYKYNGIIPDTWLYEYRFPDSVFAGIGMIENVYYPNGSYTKYEYEPNTYSFSNDTTDDRYDKQWLDVLTENDYTSSLNNLLGPGCRIKKIISLNATQSYTKEFSYQTNNISNGRLTNYPILQYGFKFVNEPDDFYYNSVIERFSNDLNRDPGNIIYDKITVFDGGKEFNTNTNKYYGKNGKTEYYFSTHSAKETDADFNENFPYKLKVLPYNKNGLLLKTKVFDKNNNPKSINETVYSTDETGKQSVSLKAINNAGYNINYYTPNPSFLTGLYTYKQRKIYPVNTSSTIYSSDNLGTNINNNTVYEYNRNGKEFINPVRKIKTLSNGDVVRTELYYTNDTEFDNIAIFEDMRQRNILNTAIKSETFKNDVKISGEKTIFGYKTVGDKNIIVIKEKQIFEEGNYKTISWFDKYNNKGNLLESHGIDNIHNSIIYNSDNSQIIANVINANEGEVFHDDFEELTENYSTNSYTGKYSKKISGSEGSNAFAGVHDFNVNELVSDKYTYSAWFNTNTEGVLLVLKEWSKSPWQSYTVPNTNGKWEYYEFTADIGSFTASKLRCEIWANGKNALVDNVRFHPTDAYMSTATYKPLIGKTSETDANGISGFIEYDEFGRVIKAFDQDKNLISKNEYNQTDTYFNIVGKQNVYEGCPLTLRIETMEGNATKNISYEWFSDACGGTLIGSEASIVVTPEISYPYFYNDEVSFFARISVNGVYSPCIEHKVSIYPKSNTPIFDHYFTNWTLQEDENNNKFLEVEAPSISYIFDDVYKGCGNMQVNTGCYGITPWFSATSDGNNLVITVDENTDTKPPDGFPQYREGQIGLTDDDGNSLSFYIRQNYSN